MTSTGFIPTHARPAAERGTGVFHAAAERLADHRTGTATVLQERQGSFSDVLAGASGNRSEIGTRADVGGRAEAARRAAEDFVSVAFVAPVLKLLRDGNRAAPPFAPGPAEKQFGTLMDQHVARQIARAGDFPLVDRVARDLLRTRERVAPVAPQSPLIPPALAAPVAR